MCLFGWRFSPVTACYTEMTPHGVIHRFITQWAAQQSIPDRVRSLRFTVWTSVQPGFVHRQHRIELGKRYPGHLDLQAFGTKRLIRMVSASDELRPSSASGTGFVQNGVPVCVCSRKRRIISTVASPGVPHPILRPSSETIGMTSAAVPVKNASSAV